MPDLNERGLREGLAALADVRRAVMRMLVAAETKATEAEVEMNTQRKILGFVDQQVGEYRSRLETIMAQKEEMK